MNWKIQTIAIWIRKQQLQIVQEDGANNINELRRRIINLLEIITPDTLANVRWNIEPLLMETFLNILFNYF